MAFHERFPALIALLALLATGRSRRYVAAGVGAELLYLGSFLVGLEIWGLTGAVAAYVVFSGLMIPVYLRALDVPLLRRLDARSAAHGVAALLGILLLTLLPTGTWTSRLAAVALAGAWLVVRRGELLRGLRS